jgi:hypothetical protein
LCASIAPRKHVSYPHKSRPETSDTKFGMDWLKKAAANVESKLAQSGLAEKLKPVTVAAGQAAGETTSLFKSIGSSIESSFNEASKGEYSILLLLSCLSARTCFSRSLKSFGIFQDHQFLSIILALSLLNGSRKNSRKDRKRSFFGQSGTSLGHCSPESQGL